MLTMMRPAEGASIKANLVFALMLENLRWQLKPGYTAIAHDGIPGRLDIFGMSGVLVFHGTPAEAGEGLWIKGMSKCMCGCGCACIYDAKRYRGQSGLCPDCEVGCCGD